MLSNAWINSLTEKVKFELFNPDKGTHFFEKFDLLLLFRGEGGFLI